MKLSRKWLNEFTDINVSDKEFNEKMTMSGSKVETIENLMDTLKNVVVGRVSEITPHTNSDHLFICNVDVGREDHVIIVTGAQNVSQGDIVPVALHKSIISGGVKIEKGKIRGVKSEGMLCSLSELGLSLSDYPYADEDGIWIIKEDCKVGSDIRTLIGYDDSVVDFEITNNRPDCFSVRGLAREAAVTFGEKLRLPEPVVKGSGGNVADYLDVEVEDTSLCSRYTARVVRNVKIKPSPAWMRQRLRTMGVRPINNIVDITNYVMLEYGQPLHAFDHIFLSGAKIIVRTAKEGETMNTLDGTHRTLTPDMLLICDSEKPVALAGVMGGENSEIKDDTVTVVFESANFNGSSVRKTALKLGMRTESSSRFEKGLDVLGTMPAIERACELVESIGAGEVVDGVIDVIGTYNAPTKLKLEPERINSLLGTDISIGFMEDCLKKLGFGIEGDMVIVPSWRADISHYTDLAEEVARFYGYNLIEEADLSGLSGQGHLTEAQKLEKQTGSLCRALGYSEILTYSFIGHSDNNKVNMPADSESETILNPLGEDRAIMRISMLPSIMQSLSMNFNQRLREAKLYELARVYLPRKSNELPDERKVLVMGAYGNTTDFYSFKGMLEALFSALRLPNPVFVPACDEYAYHPGRCALIYSGDLLVGRLGQIHPDVCNNYDIALPVYAAEVDFYNLCACRTVEILYNPIPRYPSVLRDLAVICAEGVTVAELSDCIKESGGRLLRKVEFFDVYKGASIPDEKKSVAFSLEFRSDEKSLSDDDVNPIINAVLESLGKRYGAVIR